MTVLIVGGAGYIGSHVTKWLSQRGIETVVLDDLSRGSRAALRWGRFYEGSCGSRPLLDRVFSENAIDAVMHFAAFAYVGESVEKPDLYYGNNVAATLTLLDAMVAHGVRHFVFSSSCATFGEALSLPIDETHPQNPINPYGRSKLMVEWILKDYDRAFGLRSCVFRYFNAAGCDPEGEKHKRDSEISVAFEQWGKYLQYTYGSVDAGFDLFLRHSYLSVLARFLVATALWPKEAAAGGFPISTES